MHQSGIVIGMNKAVCLTYAMFTHTGKRDHDYKYWRSRRGKNCQGKRTIRQIKKRIRKLVDKMAYAQINEEAEADFVNQRADELDLRNEWALDFERDEWEPELDELVDLHKYLLFSGAIEENAHYYREYQGFPPHLFNHPVYPEDGLFQLSQQIKYSNY